MKNRTMEEVSKPAATLFLMQHADEPGIAKPSKTEMVSTAILGNSTAMRPSTFYLLAYTSNLCLIQLSSTNTELSSTY